MIYRLTLNTNKYIWVILQILLNLEAELISSESIHIKLSFLTYGSSFLIIKVVCKIFNWFLTKNYPSFTLNCFIWYTICNTHNVNVQIKEFPVFALSQRLLKLGLKIRTLLNSRYPELFQNVLTFIPRWSEARNNDKNIPWGFFPYTLYICP